MKERPILFNGAMVRAIQAGQKTVTRRAIKHQPDVPVTDAIARREYPHGPATVDWYWRPKHGHLNGMPSHGWDFKCPFGQVGDRLWVRETWFCDHFEVMSRPYRKPADLDLAAAREDGTLVYAADGLTPYEAEQPTWRPSIHMPRWASRILLEVTAVRVERLQAISRADIRAEGLVCPPELASDDVSPNYRDWFPAAFRALWESTGGDWAGNPWVWVVEFQRVQPEALAAGAAA